MATITRSATVCTQAGTGNSWTIDAATALQASGDSSSARVTCNSTATKQLWCTNFGFGTGEDAIPENAVISKLVLTIRMQNFIDGTYAPLQQLVSEGSGIGENQYHEEWGYMTYNPAYINYSFSTFSLWGVEAASMTPALISGDTFGVALIFQNGADSDTLWIDYLKLVVTYTVPATGSGSRYVRTRRGFKSDRYTR